MKDYRQIQARLTPEGRHGKDAKGREVEATTGDRGERIIHLTGTA